MPLTDLQIRKAKPAGKPVRLFDGGGLYLEISSSGGKLWRMKYRHSGKEKRQALGAYPAVPLEEARRRRDAARAQLANGIDPGEVRKAEKQAGRELAANTFESVACEWFAKERGGWAASHADKLMARLRRDLFPWIGVRPIAEITAPEVLACLRRIVARGAVETAHKAQWEAGAVFRYGVATGRAERDPTGDLRGALPAVKRAHFAARVTPSEVGDLLRTLEDLPATFPVKCALQLAPLLFVRPGELRTMRWADVDLDGGEWRYVVPKTKTPHIVPLSVQAVAVLRELHPLTGGGGYVFPGARDPEKPMSDAAIGAAMRRAGIDTKTDHAVHGFRAMARTLLHEELGFPPEAIEHQLAHRVPDALGAAYNRTRFLTERRRMMQAWADCLDRLRDGAAVVDLTERRRAA